MTHVAAALDVWFVAKEKFDITEEELIAMKGLAALKIHAKRDALVKELTENNIALQSLSARNREIDRQLMECRAATKLFGIEEPAP